MKYGDTEACRSVGTGARFESGVCTHKYVHMTRKIFAGNRRAPVEEVPDEVLIAVQIKQLANHHRSLLRADLL